MVKDFASISGRDLHLDFDAMAGDVETRLSLLCHWVLQLAERQQPFALSLPGQLLSADSGELHRDACLRALALLAVRHEPSHDNSRVGLTWLLVAQLLVIIPHQAICRLDHRPVAGQCGLADSDIPHARALPECLGLAR